MTDTDAATAASDDREFDYPIKDEDIERAKLLIGLDVAVGMREYYSQASRDAIRNFALSYGDDNPLYTDFEYGTNTRWGCHI
jgi:hypothetical protein